MKLSYSKINIFINYNKWLSVKQKIRKYVKLKDNSRVIVNFYTNWQYHFLKRQ